MPHDTPLARAARNPRATAVSTRSAAKAKPAARALGPKKGTAVAGPHFNVSAALKRIIGRDLITNELVAIFELVKNSYDAGARRVDLLFKGDTLVVADNGKGMTADDIRNKWLFVAYSAKREGVEDGDYRRRIGQHKTYAGSKGVGRFSCDRLGESLQMQTRSASASGSVELVTVHWDRFEQDARERFESIPVDHVQATDFVVPVELTKPSHGTVLKIGSLRETWDRTKLLRLRAALAKLINPFGGPAQTFQVHLVVPAQKKADAVERKKKVDGAQDVSQRIVNGPIQNFLSRRSRENHTHRSRDFG